MRYASVFVVALALAAPAGAQTLDKIEETGVLTVGFRPDSPPFSYAQANGFAAGFTIELCKAVAIRIRESLDLERLNLKYVPLTTEERFDALVEGRVDILCGADTHSLARRERVDFSIPTFVDGTSVLYRADGPASFEALAGKRVGVLGKTTTEKALRSSLTDAAFEAEIVNVASHDDALEKLRSRDISAYFSDRGILFYLAAKADEPDLFRVSERQFTIEPYALALTKGDTAFRLEVDRALSRIYRSGEIERIFGQAFGSYAELSDSLRLLYLASALPE